jgi:hypothetical protein
MPGISPRYSRFDAGVATSADEDEENHPTAAAHVATKKVSKFRFLGLIGHNIPVTIEET